MVLEECGLEYLWLLHPRFCHLLELLFVVIARNDKLSLIQAVLSMADHSGHKACSCLCQVNTSLVVGSAPI